MSHASSLEVIARLDSTIPHGWGDDGLICSRWNEFFEVLDLKNPSRHATRSLPWGHWQRLSKFRLVDRLFKNSILHVWKSRAAWLVLAGRSWWRVDHSGATTLKMSSRTRPMYRGICESSTGAVYVAEYTLNPKRHAVRIFRTRDFTNFEVAWEFPPRGVRHVHALVRDPEERNRIWVLTGDRDEECAIYFTEDDFVTLTCFLRRGQESRAVDLVIRDGSLFWGMDSPNKSAYLMRADKSRPNVCERMCRLAGPAYYMTQNDAGGIYVGTTVERGRAVCDRRARLYRFTQDGRADVVVSFQKDWVPQHGILILPRGILPGNYVVFSQRGLHPNEGCLTIARDWSLEA